MYHTVQTQQHKILLLTHVALNDIRCHTVQPAAKKKKKQQLAGNNALN